MASSVDSSELSSNLLYLADFYLTRRLTLSAGPFCFAAMLASACEDSQLAQIYNLLAAFCLGQLSEACSLRQSAATQIQWLLLG